MKYKDNCCICREIHLKKADKELGYVYSQGDRVVWENDEYVLTPTVSPLAKGHALLFPKIHITSFGQLEQEEFQSFLHVFDTISKGYNAQYGDFIFFEHGVGTDQPGGCGIDHAHFHFLPLDRTYIDYLFEELAIERTKDLFDLAKNEQNSTYIIVGTGNKYGSLTKEKVESQFLRRAITRMLKLDSWDWKEHFNKEMFFQTKKELSTLFV